MADIHSNPYRPDPEQCCERCVFGTGEHADWCEEDSLVAIDPAKRPNIMLQLAGGDVPFICPSLKPNAMRALSFPFREHCLK